MPDRARLLAALATMPDEAFGWFVMATLPAAMTHGAQAQIWPDGIGGFTDASRAAITEVQAAAAAYLEQARHP
jgi:hypothetical protein